MRVAIVGIPGVQIVDLAGPMDRFSEANTVMPDSDVYSVQIIAASREPVPALNGTRFLPDATIDRSFDGVDGRRW